MQLRLYPATILLTSGLTACFVSSTAPAAGLDLADAFAHPPASAKPWVYWYFMDGNMTREGMTADLESMKQVGIGGTIFLEVNIGIPRGPVDLMSPQWLDFFAHGAHEADRLGIEIALGAGPGWCGAGGPWLTPEQSMQHLVSSETNVVGPAKFSAVLPRPLPRKPYFGEGTLTPELKKQWQEFYRDVVVLAFPTPDGTNRITDVEEKALYHRDPYSSMAGVKPFLPAPAAFRNLPGNNRIDRAGVVDLTAKLSPGGLLNWDVPPGRWTIMRLGRTTTGQTTRPAPQPGLGFESDKFDRAALDAHFAAFISKILAHVGPHTNAHGGLTMLHFDSWEMSSQNWSTNFREQFQKRRGYDPLKFLPSFNGRIVDSEEISERFLWDVRHTASELVFENHVGYLGELAHQHGMTLSVEPYDLNPAGDLTLGRAADVPQCEFWSQDYTPFHTEFSCLEAVSIAHTCGRSIVAAEAFTSDHDDWRQYPGSMKAQGDWAFCAGINRLIFHRFQHQPETDRWPGMTMGPYGVHWERTQTWWDMSSAYHEYLARCQALLQRGVTVADVCFLDAEGAPNVFRPPTSAAPGSPPEHSGYNFDGCAPETLLERAVVKDGRIHFPQGTTYRILVTPEQRTMTPKLLHKIKSLVRDGATLFGPPPLKSPSLEQFPQCDAEVQNLAREIWGDPDPSSGFDRRFGKGRILWHPTAVKPGERYGDYSAITNLLAELNVPPDFETDGPIRFTHRREGKTDIYFVANRSPSALDANCVFRAEAAQPELFDPLTGDRRVLPQFIYLGGRTSIPMHFEGQQSFFVLFQPSTKRSVATGQNFPTLKSVLILEGPWSVGFDAKWGGPEEIVFDSLDDWSKRPEPGIKYYSGKAVYRKSFEVPAQQLEAGARRFLDLGEVQNLAHVKLNGRDLGIVWCAPWHVDATMALRAGTNEIQIEVANLWPNRMIRDQSLPPKQRLTKTTYNPFNKDSALLPSGLRGPVTLQISDTASGN